PDWPERFTWGEGARPHFAVEGFNAGDKPNRSLTRPRSTSTLPHEKSIGITPRLKEEGSEIKTIVRHHKLVHEVALCIPSSNVPLKRGENGGYLLSSGVGLATFRPLVVAYFKRTDNVNQLHSLNIDSSTNYLFPDIFESAPDKKFPSQFGNNRKDYYEEVK